MSTFIGRRANIGLNNILCSTCSNTSAIIAGESNTQEAGYGSIILGGGFNRSCPAGAASGIVAGGDNYLCAERGFIGGGFANRLCHNYSAVVGGFIQCTSAACQTRIQALSKASGTFRIDHPDPEKTYTHYLSHSFVESPTAGDNIYRFTVTVENGTAVIDLPSYYKYLNENDQVWVNSQGHHGHAYGEVNEDQTQLTIHADIDGAYNVLLIGTRKDHDALHHWQGVETYK
jgi:hypothetical protein